MEMYHNYLQEIVDNYFNNGLFAQMIDSIDTLISSHVEADPTAFYDYATYKAATIELKELGLLRAKSIEGQLNGTIPSTSSGQSTDPSKLIDASSVNLSALGSQGGGEHAEQFKNMTEDGFDGMGERPTENVEDRPNNAITEKKLRFGNQPAVITSEFDVNTWLFIGGCTILLLAGLTFVVSFKRRQGA